MSIELNSEERHFMVSTTAASGADAQDELQRHIVNAVEVASIPALLMTLFHLTGSERWISAPFLPRRIRGMSTNDDGGLPEDVQRQVRDAAVPVISEWFASGRPDVEAPDAPAIERMLGAALGEPVPDGYESMVAAEAKSILGMDKAPAQIDVPEGFGVVIVGAGVSGICAAASLQRRGVPFTIYEKHDDLGGVWIENTYPGAAVDTPSHIYSFSFALHDWEMHFASQKQVREYLESVVDRTGIRSSIKFGHEVNSAEFDEERAVWKLKVESAKGVSDVETPVLISAVGLFNPPMVPALEGLESFEGPARHTAEWPADLDLTGLRVGVVGNGASAMQVVPAICEKTSEVVVFQRTPQWAAPNEKFQREIPADLRWLMVEFPIYRLWYRVLVGWVYNDRIYDSLRKDPTWKHNDRSLNIVNDKHREFFTDYIVSELGERQDLLPDVLPKYPPFGKRMLMDNGWYSTLTRDDVKLVTASIDHVTPKSIVTADGVEHELDVIAFATGFEVLKYVDTMSVRGVGGRTLRDVWGDDDARAYLGGTIPGFPNFFVLYGPHAQPGHGGSYMAMVESQVDYVMSLIEQLVTKGLKSVAVQEKVWARYNKMIDDENERMVWTHPGMGTYYRNSKGRVVVNLPFTNVAFWSWTRQAELEEFEATR
jgi:4-hydroxyacetophenone monooxygenase